MSILDDEERVIEQSERDLIQPGHTFMTEKGDVLVVISTKNSAIHEVYYHGQIVLYSTISSEAGRLIRLTAIEQLKPQS